MKVIINTDGGSRGNPGPAAIGYVIADVSGRVIFEHGSQIGTTTNNIAEYTALLKALQMAQELGAEEALVRMDSELIVRQMTGLYKIRDSKLQQLAQQVLTIKNKFVKLEFIHVRREDNGRADKLVNAALDGEL